HSLTYLKFNPTWHIEDSAWKAGYIVDMLKKNNLQPDTIVDVGCGIGEVLSQVHAKLEGKTNCEGFEVAQDAYTACLTRQKPGLSYSHGDAFATDKKYDVLLMIDVFEHVEDYFSFLRKAAKKATYKVYHIPLDISVHAVIINNFKYVRVPGGHINYYTKDTALASLRETGHEIVDWFYTPGALERNNKGLTLFGKLLNFCRRIVYKINKDAAAKYFGGFSLMVLTK
ncbi:MAG: class I SAM-dependent methyltransferase, partial [Chitinophagaceae bacterium]|nr:class I SAM-dependent methyltransferase [Chitinophagaceae bacterium]